MTTQITSENLAYRNFIHSLRSSFTKINYVRSLGYFMGYLKIDCNDYEKLRYEVDAGKNGSSYRNDTAESKAGTGET